MGQSAADKLAFYSNATSAPIAQPGYALTGSQSASFAATASTGAIAKYQLNPITGNAFNATTMTEQTTTVSSGPTAGLATSSVLFVNKPSQQAGLGIAGYRISAANTMAINYVNVSNAAITPTSETYDVVEIKAGPLVTTAVLSPTAVPLNTSVEQIFTVAGAPVLPGTVAIVNKPTAQTGLGYSPMARVVGPNQVGITFFAVSTGVVTTAVTPTAAETYSFAFIPPLQAFNPTYIYTIAGTQNATNASSVTESTTAVTGLLATDLIAGISRSTTSVSTQVVGGRVTAAGVIGVEYLTPGGAQTPAASDILSVNVQRQVPLNPVMQYVTSLAATTCAATTTVEATTTVTGLLVSSSVAINKPTVTPGLAVVGARVSAANTLAVQYANLTTTSINVPSEVYTIDNIQLQGPGTGSTASSAQSVTQQYYPAVQQSLQIAQALRTGLVALGLMAGV
ncbi:MAG TPA: hypothetical protein VGM15_03270 [Burkholderiaceae bacterium]